MRALTLGLKILAVGPASSRSYIKAEEKKDRNNRYNMAHLAHKCIVSNQLPKSLNHI